MNTTIIKDSESSSEEQESLISDMPGRGIKDTLRVIKFELTALFADLKFIIRRVLRELLFWVRLGDFLFLIIIFAVALLLLWVLVLFALVPTTIYFAQNLQTVPDLIAVGNILESGANSLNGLLTNPSIQLLAGSAGLLGVVIRLLQRSEFDKFRDKVNSRTSGLTYIFGSSQYAERLVYAVVDEYGYEDYLVLISNKQYLWVEKMGGLIDTYVTYKPETEELLKSKFYREMSFKNASRILVLTDDVNLNQNIVVNIREQRPEVEIVILSQYTPAFLKNKELVDDPNIIILDDLEAISERLMLSLSLDIGWPRCSEITSPKTFIGKPGTKLTGDVGGLECLLIKRGDELLPSTEIIKAGDRLILHYTSNWDMKRTNRIVNEFPVRVKKPKVTKDSKVEKDGETTELKDTANNSKQEQEVEI